ncbi:hypothetical protein ACFW4O_31360 [Streptomyces mutabilis]|uniref:hypothetical protein n=1 Tax=Streptomyces TaxID=1883 RepID=UPI0015C91A9F|nr:MULTISPECIES: hypothetical protein [unclassified Streptomyces]MDN3244243.1 hypothetical protein [Streptomyces sp. ZSW22]MDN3255685.1 hypothetical protein [Streptomyces sp. MA25(2023)]
MSVTRGLVAEAAGTVALNLTAYGDMPLRGRGAGDVPGLVPHLVCGFTTASVHGAPR